MLLARVLTIEHELIDALRLPRVPRREQSHFRLVVFELVNHAAPAAEAADVFVRSRTIDQLEQRWRGPVEHRKQQPEAERIGVPADCSAEEPSRLFRDLPQRPLIAELRLPDRSVDIRGVGTLRMSTLRSGRRSSER